MKKIYFLSLFTCSMLLIGGKGALLRIDNLDDLLKEMENHEETITTMKFNFIQTLSLKGARGDVQESTGKAYFKKPMSVRVEHLKPEKNIFITNGKDAWYYAPAFKQVMVGSWEELGDNAGNFFKGLLNANGYLQDMRDTYTFVFEGRQDAYYMLTMYPKIKKKDYFEMKLWIDSQYFYPCKTELILDTMTIQTVLQKVTFNNDLPESLFLFDMPSNVEQMSFP
ncbi:MAG: outer membrane lipoprotein carrier protein LolA [bacterium]